MFPRDCIFDLCAEQQETQLRCDSYKVYADACQEEGVKLGPWRQQLGCGKTSRVVINAELSRVTLERFSF